jgi:hypothetical protein
MSTKSREVMGAAKSSHRRDQALHRQTQSFLLYFRLAEMSVGQLFWQPGG